MKSKNGLEALQAREDCVAGARASLIRVWTGL
jgi:hypothetical protein